MSRAQRVRAPRAPRLAPEERRAQLLAAAIRVFARRGLSGARPAEVAREARVSEATVYVYFPTREALVTAVFDEVGSYFVALNRPALEKRDATLSEVLAGLLRTFGESVESDPDYTRIWLNWSTAIRDDVWPRFLAVEDRIIQQLTETIRRLEGGAPRGAHPEDCARLLIAAAEMIARLKLSGRPAAEAERFGASVVAMLA